MNKKKDERGSGDKRKYPCMSMMGKVVEFVVKGRA
jgi:hypothetical protein